MPMIMATTNTGTVTMPQSNVTMYSLISFISFEAFDNKQFPPYNHSIFEISCNNSIEKCNRKYQ